MHAAPKAHWPVQRLRFGVSLYVVLWMAGLLAQCAWHFLSPGAPVAHVGAFLALCVSGAVAWRDWIRAPTGELRSDAQGWRWVQANVPAVQGKLEVCLDLQRVLLLRFMSERRGVAWLWVASSGDAHTWRAFRRAVFSPGGRGVPAVPEQVQIDHDVVAR